MLKTPSNPVALIFFSRLSATMIRPVVTLPCGDIVYCASLTKDKLATTCYEIWVYFTYCIVLAVQPCNEIGKEIVFASIFLPR